jgi:D-alanine-D-alanine ligase
VSRERGEQRKKDAGDRREPLRVTVLCGGPSAERDVSLDSGKAVAEALRQRAHEVFVGDIGPDNLKALDHPADVVFPALHGTFGEDGAVQRILEDRGIPFVGSDSRASAIAMDKVLTKKLVAEAGMNTPAFEVWDRGTIDRKQTPDVPLPVVVKPVDQGSSVATSIVKEAGAFVAAARPIIEEFGRVLVERFTAGDELTVGIIRDTPLPPICVRPKRQFYDYEAKYRDDATEYLFDAGYSAALLERAQEASLRVFKAVGCRHLARIDWIVGADETLWFLEVNTLPGFTSHSLVPKAAARAGVPFDELVDRLVRMAIEEAS